MEITELGKALLYFIGGMVMILMGLFTSWLIRPSRQNPVKSTTYECGEDPVGSAWTQFNIRFYVMGLIFLIFDVELILLFPWAYAFTDREILAVNPAWPLFSLLEIIFFLVILVLGLIYIWKNEDIDWVKPNPIQPIHKNVVPEKLYQDYNLGK